MTTFKIDLKTIPDEDFINSVSRSVWKVTYSDDKDDHTQTAVGISPDILLTCFHGFSRKSFNIRAQNTFSLKRYKLEYIFHRKDLDLLLLGFIDDVAFDYLPLMPSDVIAVHNVLKEVGIYNNEIAALRLKYVIGGCYEDILVETFAKAVDRRIPPPPERTYNIFSDSNNPLPLNPNLPLILTRPFDLHDGRSGSPLLCSDGIAGISLGGWSSETNPAKNRNFAAHVSAVRCLVNEYLIDNRKFTNEKRMWSGTSRFSTFVRNTYKLHGKERKWTIPSTSLKPKKTSTKKTTFGGPSSSKKASKRSMLK